MADEMRSDTQSNVVASSIRRHIVLVLVVTIAFASAAVAFTVARPARYTSTAKVVVNPITGNPLSPESLSSGQQTTVAMTTEAAVVTAPRVYESAVEAERPRPLPPPSAVKAIVPPKTKIVQIRVTADSAVLAANAATAYAEAFLKYRTTQAHDIIDAEVSSLNNRLSDARDAYDTALANAKKPNPPPDAQTQVQLWATQIASITASIGDLEATDTDPGSIVSDALPPKAPDGLNPILLVLAAVLLGLGAGALLAIWRDRRDDRIHVAYDHVVAGVPMLASLPGTRPLSPRRLADLHADDEIRTSYRRARAGVIASTGAPAVLVVSSADRGPDERDPAGEVAANLGWSLTSAGFAVTLVDATIGHGHVAELLDLEPSPGLSEQLIVKGSTPPRLQETFGMNVVSAGRDPEGAREFYAGARLAKSLAWFTAASDYLIVAGPPLSTPDGEAVALVGDAVLLVVVDKQTTHRQVAAVLTQVNTLNVRVVGAVGLQRRMRETPRRTRRSRRHPSAPEALPPRPVTASGPITSKPETAKSAGSLRRDDGR